MIDEFRIQNARVFKDKLFAFPLTRLSILCGANSAGKSTVLKCLLLLRQTLEETAPIFPSYGVSRLRLSSSILDLGTFKSFVSANDTEKLLTLGATVSALMSRENYRALDPDCAACGDDDDNGRYTRYRLHADFVFGKRDESTPESAGLPSAKMPSANDDERPSDNQAVLRTASITLLGNDGSVLFTCKVIREPRRDTGQNDYFLRTNRKFLTYVPYLSEGEAARGEGEISFRVAMSGIFPGLLIVSTAPGENGPSLEAEAPEQFWPLPPFLEESMRDFRAAFQRINYLGPLRAPAKRFYLGEPDVAFERDLSGETLPYLLKERLYSTVDHVEPLTHQRRGLSMIQSLNRWLYYMRTGVLPDDLTAGGKELALESLAGVLVQLGIRSPLGDESHAMADSGFGYSQVLPILVRGILARPSETFIVEQPEVHLNPGFQVRLAEFLVAMASCGKQIVVETHSEHIVNTVRAITAEKGNLGRLRNPSIMYIEQTVAGSTVRFLNIREDGSVPDWPPSFFGESSQTLGRILRAQRAKVSR